MSGPLFGISVKASSRRFQSDVRQHKSSPFIQAIFRFSILAVVVFFIASIPSRAQIEPATHTFTTHSLVKDADISSSLFAQSTSTSDDPSLRQATNSSPGVSVSFRNSYHWWLGFDVNYGYTHFSERYSNRSPDPFASVQTNMNQFSAAYLIKGPKLRFGLRPYGEAGVGSIVFSPTSNDLVTHPRSDITIKSGTFAQTRWPGVSAAGVDMPSINSHLGARFEYRDLWYTAPNFHNGFLASSRPTVTQELLASLYFKF